MTPALWNALFAALGQQITGLETGVTLLATSVQALAAGGGGGPSPTPPPPPPPGQSNTPAFDRPIPVIIVGARAGVFPEPKGGGGGGGGGPKKPPAPRVGPRGGAAEAGERLGKIMGLATLKFLAVLAPLAALGTVLGQTTSGTGVFRKAVDVMGATLGTVLLPVFALLAAGVLTASDVLWNKLKPNLERFYTFVGGEMADGLNKFVDGVGKAADAAISFAEWVGRNRETIRTTAEVGDRLPTAANMMTPGWWKKQFTDLGNLGGGVGRKADEAIGIKSGDSAKTPMENLADLADKIAKWQTGLFGGGKTPAEQRPPAAATPPAEQPTPDTGDAGRRPGMAGVPKPPGAAPGGGKDAANRAMQDVLQSLRMSMGGQASIGGVAELNTKAQQAAMNVDPLQRRVMERALQAFEELEKSTRETADNTKRQPPTAAPLHPGQRGRGRRGLDGEDGNLGVGG